MESLLEQIRTVLAAETDIAAIYLFGSQHTGRTHPESDVDIAIILTGRPLSNPTRRLTLLQQLEETLHKPVDLVLMNFVDPILRHQIFSTGTLVELRNEADMQRCFVQTINEYDDVKRMRAPIEARLRQP